MEQNEKRKEQLRHLAKYLCMCDELFEGKAMEYLTEDIYCVGDKIDALYEALGYLLLDENELPDDLVAETKRMREHLKHFQDEFTKAQAQTQT